MSNFKIAVIPGDGIGPEIVEQSVRVLDRVGEIYGHHFEYTYLHMGGDGYDYCGKCFPDDVLPTCQASDAVLLGAVGGPKWEHLPNGDSPEKALLAIRSGLGLYANLRPAAIHPALKSASPLKPEILEESMDILIVRELTGGIYFGERGTREGKYGIETYDVEAYSEFEVRRIAKIAYEAAMTRRKRLCSIDKANVLESSRMWRRVVSEMNADYPEVQLDFMYIDNATQQLIRKPGFFDVIVTSNMFGDILSDEASQITGSIGMLPSASLGEGSFGMYEPIHGSAPSHGGKDEANPLATVLSAAMMLKYTLGLPKEAAAIEAAVEQALEDGVRTYDIALQGQAPVGTKAMGDAVIERLR